MSRPQAMETKAIPRVAAPARLVVAAERDSDIGRIMNMLRLAGLTENADSRRAATPVLVNAVEHGGLARLPEMLEANEDDHLLLFHDMPVLVVARAMAEGQSPAEALAEWQEQAERLLALVRRHRRRITLLPLDAALEDPEGFIQAIASRFDLGIEAPTRSEPAPETPGAVFRMMAENAVWQHAEARHLAAELQASALPVDLPHSLATPAVDLVFEEYRHNLETARQETERKLSNRKDPKVTDLQEENDLLLQQLHHVQEELETYYLNSLDRQHDSDEVRKLRRKNELLERRVNYIENSRSWKITGPMRAFIKIFKRSG